MVNSEQGNKNNLGKKFLISMDISIPLTPSKKLKIYSQKIRVSVSSGHGSRGL